MAQQHRENILKDEFISDLENVELNRQLCAVATDEMFESWSPETQEQILSEWDDWHEESEKSGLCCNDCGRVFTRSDNLNRHMKTNSDKDHECSRCHKTFNRKDALNRHMKTHSDKDHECSRCHKKFNRMDVLNQHMKTHSDKDHKCSRCHKTFNRKDDLSRHMKMHERRGAERGYTCNPINAKSTKLAVGNVPRRRPGARRASTSAVVNEGPHPFPEDLLLPPPNLPSQLHRDSWRAIRTRQSRGNRIQDWYNYRLSSVHMGQLVNSIQHIFEDQTTAFKLNLSFGFVLFNNETKQMQHHHPSANNSRVFDSPFQIRNREDLGQVREAMQNIDIHEWAKQQRPNSKWIVMDITNATFYVTKLRDHPIGRSTRLPKYVLENPATVSLDCDSNTSLPYEDKLCFFRCLALHQGCHPKNLERDTQHFYKQYSEDDDFDGVTLEELPELEKLFELNIYVYRLTELHEEDDDTTSIVAQLIQRSHRSYSNSLYLNLYGSHFSYIKNLDTYLDRSDYEYCEMDTDSAYIAISGESVEELVKPGLREAFENDKCNWSPRSDTTEHAKYDRRKPGLFKVEWEWEGDGIVSLCT
ncbi:Zinc finger and SCAN domain-containing 22 [Paramuricea clavata]|uniref:Zinc finger and SCAN domain-containing 22 n=1 Tax=Paramuricea clavata TaxID=317549 RepID=A0A6S7GWL8_PARCT|nr:Zinc finger and SCAN domain-containing 22 [Paramuricea clavata]